MNCLMYHVGLLTVLFVSVDAAAMLRCDMRRSSLFESVAFDVRVTDCDQFSVAPDDVKHFNAGAIPGSEVRFGERYDFHSRYDLDSLFEAIRINSLAPIRGPGPEILRIMGYHDSEVLHEEYMRLLHDVFAAWLTPYRRILFEGSSISLNLVGRLLCAALAYPQFKKLKTVSVGIGGFCGAGSSLSEDLRRSSCASSASCPFGTYIPPLSGAIALNTFLCSSGGAAYLNFDLFRSRGPTGTGKKYTGIDSLNLVLVIPRKFSGLGCLAEKDPSLLFEALPRVIRKSNLISRVARCTTPPIFLRDKPNSVRIFCYYRGSAVPFFRCSGSDLNLELQLKILGTLDALIPEQLKAPDVLWA